MKIILLYLKDKKIKKIHNKPSEFSDIILNNLIPFRPEFNKFLSSNFSTKSSSIITNPSVLQNEYLNDDFYYLRFPVENSLLIYNLKIIDLTNSKLPYMNFKDLKANKDRYLMINNNEVLNPHKTFKWINSLEEIMGNCLRIEISSSDNFSFIKYIYLDLFSFENYAIALLEIANYEKHIVKKTEFEKANPDLEAQNAQGFFSEFRESKLSILSDRRIYDSMNTNAFRYLIQRLSLLNSRFKCEPESKVHVLVKGPVIIEFKNCTILSYGIDSFEILEGNSKSVLGDLIYKIDTSNPDAFKIKINVIEDFQNIPKIKKIPIKKSYLKVPSLSSNLLLYKNPSSIKLPGEVVRNLNRQGILFSKKTGLPDQEVIKKVYEKKHILENSVPQVTVALIPSHVLPIPKYIAQESRFDAKTYLLKKTILEQFNI